MTATENPSESPQRQSTTVEKENLLHLDLHFQRIACIYEIKGDAQVEAGEGVENLSCLEV